MAGVDKEATLGSLECHTSPPAACTDFPPQVIISVFLTDPLPDLPNLPSLPWLSLFAAPNFASTKNARPASPRQ